MSSKYENEKKNVENKKEIEKENENENEIAIIYKSLSKSKIKLFGKAFVENNKKKCKMVIRDKIEEICESIELTFSEGHK